MNVDIENDNGWTSAQISSFYWDRDTLDILVKHGANLNIKRKDKFILKMEFI